MHSIDLLMFNLALLGCNIHWVRFSDSEKWVFVLFCSHLFFYLCYMHECFACMYAYAPCAHRALKAKGDTGVPGTGVTAGCELPCSTETWTSVHWKSSQESYQLSLPSSPLLMITNGRGPQILSLSWGLPGMGPGNQTPVWSSARRARPLNCRAVSLANFLSSPFPPPFSVSHPITLLPRLTCSSWAYLTPSLSFWSSWKCMQHHVHHGHFTREQKLRETEGPKAAWLIRGGKEGLKPWTEWLQCPSRFSIFRYGLLNVHRSPSTSLVTVSSLAHSGHFKWLFIF